MHLLLWLLEHLLVGSRTITLEVHQEAAMLRGSPGHMAGGSGYQSSLSQPKIYPNPDTE